MHTKIHPTAVVDPSAVIAPDVEVGAFTVIGANVTLHNGVKVFPHVYLEQCEIGEGTVVSSGATLGTSPQDLGYKGELTMVNIGKNCHIRENVTVNRATGEGKVTVVGDNCMLMTGSHVAHNCKLGSNVILANNVMLAGHVILEDYVFIGGGTALQQHTKVGEMAFIAGMAGTIQDIPPYSKSQGAPAGLVGTNFIGLRRRGITPLERENLKKAFKFLWYSELNTAQAIEKIKEEIEPNKYIDHLLEFIANSKKGVIKRRQGRDSTTAQGELMI